MIARHWRGWTRPEDAEGYEAFLKNRVLPGLHEIEGYRRGYILRRNGGEEIEFVVLNLFDSLDAVKRFAGTNYTVPDFEPEARTFLSRIEDFATHCEVRAAPK